MPTVPPELVTAGASGAIGWGLGTLQRQANEAADTLDEMLTEITAREHRLADLAAELDDLGAQVAARADAVQKIEQLIDERQAALASVEASGRCTHGHYKACSCTDPECGHPVHSWPAADTDPLAKGETDG